MRIVFVIGRLDRAGAENQMVLLARNMNKLGHQVAILALDGVGSLDEHIKNELVVVKIQSKYRIPFIKLFRYIRFIRDFHPDVIHPYLPRQHLKTTLVKPLTKPARIVWGIRASNMDWSQYSIRTRIAFPIVTRLSKYADAYIANSRAGAEFHIQLGYSQQRMHIVHNGFDDNKFFPDNAKRSRVRNSLGVSNEISVVGMLARFDPMKRNEDLLFVGQLLKQKKCKIKLVSIGRHSEQQSATFMKLAEECGVFNETVLINETTEPEAYLNALDILLISSFSEGFPNVALEALACGTPVVSTDVGDSMLLLREGHPKIAPGDCEKLAEEICRTLRDMDEGLSRNSLATNVRRSFNQNELTRQTLEIFQNIQMR